MSASDENTTSNGSGATPSPSPFVSSAPAAAPLPVTRSHGYQVAEWYAVRLAGTFRFVLESGTWWHYHDHYWTPLTSDDLRLLDGLTNDRYLLAYQLQEEGRDELAEVLGNSKEFERQKSPKSDLWAGFRHILAGDEPRPELHHLGVPGGVVDLRDGKLYPHGPAFNIRGVTAGDYRPGDPAHLEVFHARFWRVFAPDVQRDYLRLAGLALTGRAQSFRSVVLVLGPSGSGKGGAISTLAAAMGQRSMEVGLDWLGAQHRNDIDAVGCEIVEKMPAALTFDEIGGDTKIGISRFLSLTGDRQRFQARRPHGRLIAGPIMAQLWAAAVEVPLFPRNTGINRRLALLPTLRSFEPDEIAATGGSDQELLDAIVTRAVAEAQLVYAAGYEAPEGDHGRKAEALDQMDPLASWLEELPEDAAGRATADLLEEARADLEWPDLKAAALGRKINTSERWDKARARSGELTRLRRRIPDSERLL